MHMGLSLLTVALEVGADSIGKYDTLMALVKDDMCKNLFAVSMLDIPNVTYNDDLYFTAIELRAFEHIRR